MVVYSRASNGGFDLAAEWMGWTNVFHCEINPFGRKVLNYYWPDSISYEDIKLTDFTIHRGQIDVLSGGFPCQPFSTAGKRQGTEDDRHLWPEMLRAVREIQPRYVVGENVRGLTNWSGGLVFDQVQADLEVEGYEVLPFLLPACAVNAPHRRDRIWFVAHRSEIRRNARGTEQSLSGHSSNGKEEPTPNTTGNRREWEGSPPETETRRQQGPGTTGELEGRFERLRDSGDAPDTGSIGQQGPGGAERPSSTEAVRNWKASWSYDDSRWPTQPPICSRNDGLPSGLSGITISKHRKESIMAYGNAIVPQVAFEIFKVIDTLAKSGK